VRNLLDFQGIAGDSPRAAILPHSVARRCRYPGIPNNKSNFLQGGHLSDFEGPDAPGDAPISTDELLDDTGDGGYGGRPPGDGTAGAGGGEGGGFTPVTIEEEMRRSYLDYAMSVIVSRALPDVRDGLKPVHRRILYTGKTGGYDWNRPYRKSARIVGDVMGQYHPHGDQAIYDAMVRMAQDFSMREELIDGQGNFGSMDGDPPAAMRYTEARLTRLASDALLEDIDKDTVDFQPNYDESTTEPTVLPARFPNLLVNGAGGIAVGMATNIPPHNLGDVLEACCAFVDNPEVSIEELIEIVQGPDFPTGGLIVGRSGILKAYTEGRGSILMRGRTSFEPADDPQRIVIEDVPYQVNKARMIERIAEVVREKQVEGISALRDESDRHGLRVVIELKRDADANVVLNQLYRFTPLQTSFGVNMLAIDAGRPKQMTLKEVIAAFVEFREEVIRRRTAFELNKARDRMIVLAGLMIAVDNIDEMIALIRGSADPVAARQEMMARDWPAERAAPYLRLIEDPRIRYTEEGERAGTMRLTEEQARAILDLRLQRLTALERDKIGDEMQELAEKVRDFLQILESRPRLLEVLRDELVEIKERFGQEGRRTGIEEAEFEADIEDLIPREEMVVTVTHAGYVKRVPLSTYRAQKRGGKGRAGMAMREEDFVASLFVCDTHTPVLFFSSRGMAYKLKVYRLPLGTPQARGKPFINLLPLEEGETIGAYMPLPEDEETWGDLFAVFATSAGTIRRNRLSDFTSVKANGKIAMKLDPGTRLIGVQVAGEDDEALLATRAGKAIRFPVGDVRVFAGRDSVGVRGIRLRGDDEVMSLSILRSSKMSVEERDTYLRWAAAQRRAAAVEAGAEAEEETVETETDATVELSPERLAELQAAEQFILTTASDGFGKRTSAYEYRTAGRGGQGIANIDLSRARGAEPAWVAATFPVEPDDQVMLVTDAGQLIRTSVHDVRIAGRSTRGVRLFRVAEDEHVVSVARVADLENGTGTGQDEAAEEAEGQAPEEGEGPGPDGEAPPEA
jgi:DNA gyrase subunit A